MRQNLSLGGATSLELLVTEDDVCIEVTDNGIGIEPELQKVIFGLFEQAQRTSDQTLGGYSGLTLVRRLAILHSGTVTCHSDGVDCGSIFTVCLPRLAPDEPVPERRRVKRLVELPVAGSVLST